MRAKHLSFNQLTKKPIIQSKVVRDFCKKQICFTVEKKRKLNITSKMEKNRILSEINN